MPKVGDTVNHPDYGPAEIERVIWRVTYPGDKARSGVICTVKLRQPFKDKREMLVQRVEYIVPDRRCKTYG